jgi:two-component system sensor histidine kinase/response regulator
MQMDGRQFKILAVDDNPKNIQVIGSILRKANYHVGFALNGQQALDLLCESDDYDLVLLDVNMPVMNGYETCIQMRRNPLLKDIPVIYLTALNEVDNIVKGFDSGAQDYVSKPFNARELLARVQTHLELKQMRKKLQQTNEWLEAKVLERTSELQKANEELEKANRELEQLDEAKADFLGIISHEINTPLNGIVGFTRILKEEMQNDDLYEMIDFLDISAKRLEKFAANSLLFTELRTKRKKIVQEETEVQHMINDVLAQSSHQIKAKKIEVVLKQDTPAVFGDRRLVYKCVECLIDNAVKFSPDYGKVTISIYKKNGFILCEFEDEGIGFSDKLLDDPFTLFPADSVHQDEDKRFSLALIKLIMDAHHGKISLSNKSDGGAKACVMFPEKSME